MYTYKVQLFIEASDLLFDPTSLMFKLDPDIIMTNILSKFEEDWVKTVATRLLIRFY